MDRCDGEDKVIIIIAIILFITGLVLGLTNTGPLLGPAKDPGLENEGLGCDDTNLCPPAGAVCEGGDSTRACIYPAECIEGQCELQGPPQCGICLPGACGGCISDGDCPQTYVCRDCGCYAMV